MSDQKEGQGVLFKNNKKEKDSQPDYTGTVTVGGEQKRLAAWLKISGKGTKYMSIQVSEQQERQEPKPAPKGDFTDMSDDVPF
jgi:hypothetical protein